MLTSLDKLISGLNEDQKSMLYERVREIRARKELALNSEPTDVTLRAYLREVYLTHCLTQGPEAGRRCATRSQSHYGLTPRGLYGHRYPSSGNLRRQKVRNAKGNQVMRPTIKYIQNVVSEVTC